MSSINPSTKNQKVVRCRLWQSPVTPQNSNHQLAIINFTQNRRRKTPKKKQDPKQEIHNTRNPHTTTTKTTKTNKKKQISHRTTNRKKPPAAQKQNKKQTWTNTNGQRDRQEGYHTTKLENKRYQARRVAQITAITAQCTTFR